MSVDNVNEFSHHSCLSFVLSAKTPNFSEDDINIMPHPESFSWNENLKDNLGIVLDSKEVQIKLEQLFSQTSSGTLCDINSIVNEFTEILSASCSKVLKIKGRRKVNKKNIPKQRQKWFNQNCHTLKKNLRNLGKLITKYPNNTYLKHTFFSKKKEYKCLLRKLKRQFHNTMLEKIEALADNNPNEYWKLVNSIKTSQKSKDHNEISSSEGLL